MTTCATCVVSSCGDTACSPISLTCSKSLNTVDVYRVTTLVVPATRLLRPATMWRAATANYRGRQHSGQLAEPDTLVDSTPISLALPLTPNGLQRPSLFIADSTFSSRSAAAAWWVARKT